MELELGKATVTTTRDFLSPVLDGLDIARYSAEVDEQARMDRSNQQLSMIIHSADADGGTLDVLSVLSVIWCYLRY